MDEHHQGGRLLAKLKQSYADRRNTLTWALLIWSVTAVGFALFLPFGAPLCRRHRGLVRNPPHPQNVDPD
jgi:hypothetical protein